MGTGDKRVLIVDDSEDLRTSVAEVLEDEGYFVKGASSGVEALDWLKATAELPDVILLDLMMPDMDGYQFRAAQEDDARLSSIPVLLMTAGGDIPVKAKTLGARGYLKKPFHDIEAILDAVERAMQAP